MDLVEFPPFDADDERAGSGLPIRTARLDLLPLRVEHAGEMAEVLSDAALHTFIGCTRHSRGLAFTL